MRMLKWKSSNTGRNNKTGWEVYIPSGTIKGAFRIRAEKVMRTLLNRQLNNGQVTDDGLIGDMFGKQDSSGKIIFSDSYLVDDKKHYCSLDSIMIDPETGEPIKKAKMDYLYAYGKDFEFTTTFYLQDVTDDALLGLFFYLLQDMKNGDIPLGGQKTSGIGWVKGEIKDINIKTGNNGNILSLINNFGEQTKDSSWVIKNGTLEQLEKTTLYSNSIKSFNKNIISIRNNSPINSNFEFTSGRKEISHALFSGYSGELSCNLTLLSPMHIKESGQPTIDNPIISQGWDFFHMSPPDNNSKSDIREYAIPSKTLKGIIKNIYQMLTDKGKSDSLFGFIDNQKGYMGRINISFAKKKAGEMNWYGMLHHYTDLLDKVYPKDKNKKRKYDIFKGVRIFTHLNFIDNVKKYPLNQEPLEKESTITPCRCAEKGSIFSFKVNFWNLQTDELNTFL